MNQPSCYADARASASVIIRRATQDERWLHDQLDRLAPGRHEMGGAGDSAAYEELVFELRQAKQRLEGEAGVMRALLDAALNVLMTVDPDSADESDALSNLCGCIRAVVEMQMVRP